MIPSGPERERVQETSEDGFFVHCETSVAHSCTQLCVPCCRLHDGVTAEGARLHGELSQTAHSLGKAGCTASFAVPSGLAMTVRAEAAGPTAVGAAAEQMTTRVREVKPALGELRAAVIVVESARQDATRNGAADEMRPRPRLTLWCPYSLGSTCVCSI